jgi:alanyl-tRNA synthetase
MILLNKRGIRIFSVILLACITMTGCVNPLESENSTLKKEIAEIKNNNTNLEKTVGELQNKLKEQEAKTTEVKETALQNKDNIFPIYTANIDTYKKEADGYIYISSSIALKQKLETLTKVLSEAYFSNLPIQVVKIEEVDKKKVAVVNLSESKENQGIADRSKYKGNSWANLYLQGSTGGEITSTQLIETLLQRDYKGEWIDGVRFLYSNGVCDYEHAPALKNINYKQ